VKSSNRFSLVVAVSLLAAFGGCKGKETAHDESTATIAPARPQPAETGTDAMTQTVELGDGRPVSEGAASETDTAATAPISETPTTTTASTTMSTTTR